MDSSIIGKIEKAKQYAEEKNRVNITSFAATFKGIMTNTTYGLKRYLALRLSFFRNQGNLSHTMALKRILDQMIIENREPPLLLEETTPLKLKDLLNFEEVFQFQKGMVSWHDL
ncbi:MAG: hypothetical protein CM1200mP27_13070 [Chloroflexota bacterium]|nr:MAG: hypothetical protein CM1200mP27_13070 [Chloroflexota bacterium]